MEIAVLDHTEALRWVLTCCIALKSMSMTKQLIFVLLSPEEMLAEGNR